MMGSAVVSSKGDRNEVDTIEMISVRKSLSSPQSSFLLPIRNIDCGIPFAPYVDMPRGFWNVGLRWRSR
jgi:hypothetical protein